MILDRAIVRLLPAVPKPVVQKLSAGTGLSRLVWSADGKTLATMSIGTIVGAIKGQGVPPRKVIAWDHNRDLIYQRASTILTDPQAAKFVWGIGYHWYEPWSGGEPMFDNVRLVHETFPDKHLIFTEGCVDAFDPRKLNEWKFGEQYGRSMIHDFNNSTVGWTDWNILLDETGGPNHVNNFCFAPVHAETDLLRRDLRPDAALIPTITLDPPPPAWPDPEGFLEPDED